MTKEKVRDRSWSRLGRPRGAGQAASPSATATPPAPSLTFRTSDVGAHPRRMGQPPFGLSLPRAVVAPRTHGRTDRDGGGHSFGSFIIRLASVARRRVSLRWAPAWPLGAGHSRRHRGCPRASERRERERHDLGYSRRPGRPSATGWHRVVDRRHRARPHRPGGQVGGLLTRERQPRSGHRGGGERCRWRSLFAPRARTGAHPDPEGRAHSGERGRHREGGGWRDRRRLPWVRARRSRLRRPATVAEQLSIFGGMGFTDIVVRIMERAARDSDSINRARRRRPSAAPAIGPGRTMTGGFGKSSPSAKPKAEDETQRSCTAIE